MAKSLPIRIINTLSGHFSFVCCVIYPFVMHWRYDILNPNNKAEYEWFLYYIMPFDVIAVICWFIAAYSDPGYVTAEHFLPLPDKMDNVDKATLDRLAKTQECPRCLKRGRKGIWKVEFVHHCS